MDQALIYYYIMDNIVLEGNIRNPETQGEAEVLIIWSRWLLIFPRDDLSMIYIILRLKLANLVVNCCLKLKIMKILN